MAKKKKKVTKKKGARRVGKSSTRTVARGRAAATAVRKPARKKKASARAKPKAARAAEAAAAASPPPPPPGSFIWHELMTPDVGRAKSFYSNLFNWKMQDQEMMPGFIYTTMTNKGDMVGGMMPIAPEQGDIAPHWMVYIGVRDVDAVSQQCESMGGEIVIPPHDIPVGRWALLQDPTGARFAVYKSHKKSQRH